jgi:general secretion pathway protein M
MTTDRSAGRSIARFPALALLAYCIAIAAMIVLTVSSVRSLSGSYDDAVVARDLLAQLEGRSPTRVRNLAPAIGAPQGTAFLEGQTVTVAGAALLQRVAAAVTKVGGNVQSSQVDVIGIPERPNFVSLVVSCEIDDTALQPLLYDIEAGMPYLFVDQLVVQSPQSTGRDGGHRLRVRLGVSGQWQGKR